MYVEGVVADQFAADPGGGVAGEPVIMEDRKISGIGDDGLW